jgi:hypothetical protein
MTEIDSKDKDDIFIVKVTGNSSKTINIPDAVCEFCGINNGDLIKLKLIEKRNNNAKPKQRATKKKTS